VKYLDPDGRADENYFTTFGGNGKFAYKHNNRSVIENIDIESLAFYSLNTSELYYLATQKNKSDLITFIQDSLHLSSELISLCDAVIAFGKLSVDTNPVVSASIWIASMVIDYFADASKREIESFIQCIGNFSYELRSKTGITDYSELSPYIVSMTLTETTKDVYRQNLDTDVDYRYSHTYKVITFNATVNIPGTDKTVDITCSTE